MTEVLQVTQDPEIHEQGDDIAERFESFLDALRGLEITDEDDYERTLSLLGELKIALDEAEEALDRPRQEAYDLYQHYLSIKKEALEPGQKAKDIAKSKLEDYRERKALQQEAKRKEIEEKASSGDPDKVEEALKESQELDDEPTPDVDGVHYRTNWSGELSDGDEALRKLCLAIGEGKAPVGLVSFDSSHANKLARQRKRELDEIPGVRAVRSETLVDRR